MAHNSQIYAMRILYNSLLIDVAEHLQLRIFNNLKTKKDEH